MLQKKGFDNNCAGAARRHGPDRRDYEVSYQDKPIPHGANNDWSGRWSQDYDSIVNCSRIAIRHGHAYTSPALYRVQIGASCDCEGPQYSVVLERQVTVMPKVTLSFRNSGGLSADNGNTLLGQLGISSLGLINSPKFHNAEEVQGTISPSGFQGATYDLRRVFKAPGEVISNGTVVTSIPAGSSDDNSNNDEDLTPQNDHIYGIDAPPGIGPNSAGAEGNTVVQRAKFTEFAECTVQGTTSKCSNDFDWCFVISLKYSGGAWMRDPAGTNVVQAGSSCY